MLYIDKQNLNKNYVHTPFLIKHHLQDHPLFGIPRLIELSKTLKMDDVRYNKGTIPITSDYQWLEKKTPNNAFSPPDEIRMIEEGQSWMVLKHVEQNPEYRHLMDSCLNEINQYIQGQDPGMCRRSAYIFVTSPGMLTPFHFDPEMNFLLQIRGSKIVHLWNPQNRSIITENQLEQHFSGTPLRDLNNFQYHEHYEDMAQTFELSPGHGLFFPLNAPHWIQNNSHISISFSITYQTKRTKRYFSVYRTNALLRQYGYHPMAPGISKTKDLIKNLAFKCLPNTLKSYKKHV